MREVKIVVKINGDRKQGAEKNQTNERTDMVAIHSIAAVAQCERHSGEMNSL